MLSIAYFSLLTIFCKIGYMFCPSQAHIFFLVRIANVCSDGGLYENTGVGKIEQTTPSPQNQIGSATPCHVPDQKYHFWTILGHPTLAVTMSQTKWGLPLQITGVGDSIPFFLMVLMLWRWFFFVSIHNIENSG
jgi:hypothetical protein